MTRVAFGGFFWNNSDFTSIMKNLFQSSIDFFFLVRGRRFCSVACCCCYCVACVRHYPPFLCTSITVFYCSASPNSLCCNTRCTDRHQSATSSRQTRENHSCQQRIEFSNKSNESINLSSPRLFISSQAFPRVLLWWSP
jgi:hypothetical protein